MRVEASGALTPVGTAVSIGGYALSPMVDPTGKFVFVVDPNADRLSVFQRDAGTGALTPVAGSPYVTGDYPQTVEVAPNGAFVYVGNNDNTISAFVIDAATGVLTPVPGSPFAVPGGVRALAIDPSGRAAYVLGYYRLQVFALDGTTGALTAGAVTSWNQSYALKLALAVSRTAAGATLTALQVVPAPVTLVTSLLGTTQQLTAVGTYSDGTAQFLTASATWTSSDGTVATVSNTAGSQGRVTSTGYGTTTITASFGGFTAQTTLTVSAPPLTELRITPLDPTIVQGTAVQLTALGTFADGTTRSVTADASWASSVPAVATASNAAGNRGLTTGLSAGSSAVTATLGGMTATTTVTVVAGPTQTAATGRALYATLNSPDGVAGLGIHPTTGAVTLLPGSPFGSAAYPDSVVAHPSGRFVYVAHNNSNVSNYQLSAYTVDGNTGALSPVQGSPYPVAGYVRHLAVEPSGRYLYATLPNTWQVAGFQIDATTGGLTPLAGSPFTFSYPHFPWALAFDPSGTTGYLAGYYYNTVTAVRVEASGALTPVGTAVSIGGYALSPMVDPTGKFVFVVDPNADRLSVFQRDAGTGALTPVAGSPYVTGDYPQTVEVAPNGAFVYVGNNDNTISAFVIDAATGVLTPVPGSPFAVPGGVRALAIDPSGRAAYVLGYYRLQVFALDGTTGALTAGAVTSWNQSYALKLALAVSRTAAGATLTALQVVPAPVTLVTSLLGTTQQLTAVGTYSDGTAQFLTASATWTSSDGTVATVSNTAGSQGRVTSTGYGTTTITASFGGFTAQTTLTVSAPVLTALTLTPADPTIVQGTAVQLTAIGTFSDNSTRNVTTSVTWSTANPAVAVASNAAGSRGLVTSVGGGSTLVTATSGAISGSTTFTTDDPFFTLRSILISPSNASIQPNRTLQFAATGTFADGSTRDVTAIVIWSSSAAGVATISNATGAHGLASTLTAGNATIRAATGSISATTNLNVAPPTLESIAITPNGATAALGRVQQFTAAGTFSDGSVGDVTGTSTWTSSNAAVATVSDAPATRGLASTVSVGATTITVTSGAVSKSVSFTVTPAELTAIVITPVDATVSLGVARQFTATGTMTDGSTQDVTGSVTWSSANLGVAAISNDAGTRGLVTTQSIGTTAIVATSGAVVGNTTLTVGAAALVSIAVTPAEVTLLVGRRQQFTAVGTFTDGTTQDLTSSVTWSSDPVAIATISNGAGTQGRAEAEAVGTATILAASGGVTGSAELVVQPGQPLARFTFVAVNEGVAVYSVDANTGALTEVPGSPFAIAAGTARSIAVHPAGQFVYVGNASCCSAATNVITAFAVDAATGALTPLPGSPFAAGAQPSFLALDRSGTFLYAANRSSGDVSAYRVDLATGALTPVPGSPFAGPALPTALAAHPSLDVLYAAGSELQTFTIDTATGGLTYTATLASAFHSVAVESTGRGLFASGAGVLAAFAVGQSTGVPVAVGTPLAAELSSLATTPNGAFLVGTSSGDGTLAPFLVSQTTGELVPAGSPLATGATPRAVSIDPSGRFVYVANGGSNDISTFRIDSTTGAIGTGGVLAVVSAHWPRLNRRRQSAGGSCRDAGVFADHTRQHERSPGTGTAVQRCRHVQ